MAVAEVIESFTSKAPSVKWPNDILIDSKKVAGILTEMNADMDRVNHVICGIGVNINLSPAGDEPGLNAASLSEKSGADLKGRICPRLFIRALKNGIKSFKGWFCLSCRCLEGIL